MGIDMNRNRWMRRLILTAGVLLLSVMMGLPLLGCSTKKENQSNAATMSSAAQINNEVQASSETQIESEAQSSSEVQVSSETQVVSEAQEQTIAAEEHITASPATEAPAKQYRFRKASYLTEHFQKHGAEFGYQTEEEYLAGANRMINTPGVLHKTEKEDGDDVYFLPATGEFAVVSTDGYIRTYFKPSAGIDYFNRQ